MNVGPWTCFHCGETFTQEDEARDHFGPSHRDEPACQVASIEKGIVNAYRRLQQEVVKFYNEDGELHRLLQAKEAEHGQALTSAEEKGYNEGVADMQKEPSIQDLMKYHRREGLEEAARYLDEVGQTPAATAVRSLK